MSIFIIIIIAIALIFDFTNGMHDAANSVSTIVSTRVLSPKQAVIWAAFFNFVAFLIFGTVVANTIGHGMIKIETVTPTVIFAGLLGAICWNMITWYFGLPSSSSHALIGGYAGAAIVNGGFGVIIASGWTKTLIFIALAPIIGIILGYIFKVITSWLIRKQSLSSVNKWSKVMQLFSAAAYSLGHGGNDAQKSMGIIWVALIVTGNATKNDPIALWIVLSCQAAIAFGTLLGGWRIVKTMGQKITKLKPFEGFCAETAGAITLFGATHFGIPVSTTHVITGAIIGAGARKGVSAVKWGVTTKIFWAWLLTIPVSAVVGSLMYYLLNFILA